MKSLVTQSSVPIPISIISNSHFLVEGLIAALMPRINFELLATYNGQMKINDHLINPQGHVILIDGTIGQTLATRWTHYWRNQQPEGAVVVIELADNVELILACIEEGAKGYTLRGATPEKVAHTIELVSQGRAHCSTAITAHLFDRLAHLKEVAETRYMVNMPLTSRELEVLNLIAKGCSNKEIADQLVITLRTVKHHVHNILSKLDLKHRYEAAHLAMQQGWVHNDLFT